ncbi:hypothetical protein QQS21_003670 [Conoideocrella luteorostrata]|uniref:Heterokaryon incompatibility domain-containing protein n=1 Tax=Conoideocrella luteorostrata TaxID=1105319 RepID=A0AAJ0G0F4_9HYPO|nr:hypothetical protein QQS21_003670 [Conoideocrella luteorostrata]
MTFCPCCVDIAAYELPNRDFDEQNGILPYLISRPHQADLAALTASATSCPLCKKLLHALHSSPNLQKYSDIGKPNAVVNEIKVCPEGNGTTSRLEMLRHGILAKSLNCSVNGRKLQFARVLVKRSHLQIQYDPSFTSPWKIKTPVNLEGLTSRSIWRTDIPTADRLDARLDVLRGWLDECQKNHPKCQIKTSLQKPTRLLEVKSQDGSYIMRLVDVAALQDRENIVYNTLSHCWGDLQSANLRTTRENEAKHRAGIDISALPRTYRDAVAVTQKLGVRYIWIDSLCIIQGERQDWEFEASRMSHVYHGSFLTLAATDAAGPDGGLFLAEPESPLELQYDARISELALLRCPGADVEQIHVAPLSTRAWALQEVILSPRTVHFLADQTYWQCRTLLLSEDGLVQDDKLSSLRWGGGMMFKPLDFSNAFNSREYWWKLAADYSHREMTIPADWMAGLAGITTYFEEGMGQTSVLGMWSESLVHDLSWHTSRSTRRQSRDLGPTIPSWSWMQFQRPINPPMGMYRVADVFMTVKNYQVVWTGMPLTSPLASTVLLVSSQLRTLSFVGHAGGAAGSDKWMVVGQEHVAFSACSLDEPGDLDDEQEIMTAPCVPLASYEREYHLNPETISAGFGTFLILQPCEKDATERPKYKRIGAGKFDTSEGKPDPFAGAETQLLEIV